MHTWPSTKRTQYFKRPILLGGEQPKIAGLVDSTESKQKETIHSKVQRRFIPHHSVSIIVEMVEAAENQHNQKELLLDFSFSNLILVTTRKSFETTQVLLWYPESICVLNCLKPRGGLDWWL